jgi:hypothetical protein
VQKSLFSFVCRGYCSRLLSEVIVPFFTVQRLLQSIVAHLKLTYINIMTTPQRKRKNARSGKVVRFEPHNLKLVNTDPMIRVSFEQAGCIRFCEKVQGYNVQLTKQFSLNFTGVSATIAGITFQVSEETISAATEIPMQGEKWFKGMPLDTSCYIDFIKPEYRNRKIGANIPSEYLLEPFEKLLRIIQKYFTCEGRFDKVHQYHIRLLMHFTGRSPLNLPFFLCRSLGKMADSVQAKADQPENNLFHFSLIKMLVVEELGNLNRDWDSFLISTNIPWTLKEIFPYLLRNQHFIVQG